MSVRGAMKTWIRQALRKQGYNVYRMSDEERTELENYERAKSVQYLPADLGPELLRLRELKSRYAGVRIPITNHSLWGSKGNSETKPDIGWGGVDLETFRGGNAYVALYGGSDPLAARLRFFIFADAVRRKDPMQLLDTLREDGAFGCVTFVYPGLGRISRDLLDSVVEINFLHKHLKVLDRDDLSVLDIGAGYGRMAHRMLEANPRLNSYTCVDAVPESTFLCEFYLKYRGLLHRAQVVPLDRLEQALGSQRYDLALNIHSFSECTFAAIEWWLNQLQLLNVPNLMIVPNHPEQFLSFEIDGTRRDYTPLLHRFGYELVAREPLFDDPAVQEILIGDNMFLFSLPG